MSEHADEKVAAEDPAAARGPAPTTEGKRMTDLERIRHSAAHILATAILRIWPEAQFAAGPPVENGFYYDVELPHRISPDDFERIEAEAKKEIKANHPFQRVEVSRDEALALAEQGALASLGERAGSPSKFKLDIVRNIPAGEKITLYKNGDFTDLCAGPHVGRTGNVGAFKLTHVASAYYKNDEKNPQLQRIYGTAFKNKTQMDEYFAMLEEAKKRDHRKLGKELELYFIDSNGVGPGLPLWLPRGTAIIEELEKLAKETEFLAGYERVRTPHVARENIYLTSGHLPYYADSMFPPMQMKPEDENARQLEELERQLIASDAKLEQAKEHLEQELAAENATGSMREVVTVVKEIFELVPQKLQGNEDIKQILNRASTPLESIAVKLAQRGIVLKEGRAALIKHAENLLLLRAEVERLKEAREAILSQSRYYLKAMNCPHHHKLFGAVPRSYRDLPLRFAEYGTCYRYEQSGELQGLMRVRAMQMNDAHIYCSEAQFESEFNAVNQMYLNYFKLFGFSKYQMRFSTHDPAKLGEKFLNNPELWKKTEDMVRDVLIKSNIPYVEVPNEAAFYGPKIDVQIWSAIGKEFTIATNQVDFGVPAKFGLKYKTRDNTEETPLCIHRAPLGTHERFIGFLIEHYAGNFPLWMSPEQVRVLPIGDEEPLVEYAKSVVAELRAAGVRATLDASNDPIKAKIADAEKMKVHTMLVIGNRDLEAGNLSVRVHGKGNLGAKPRAEVVAELLASIKERRAN